MTSKFEKIIFRRLFEKSSYKPIEYKNKTIYPYDDFYLKKNQQRLKFILESTNSKYLQAIDITVDGSIVVNKQKVDNGILLREDTLPSSEILFEVVSKKRKIRIKNVTIWRKSNNKIMVSPDDGSAMIVEELPDNKGKRYRCNDVMADDDFDDLIFRIEYVE